MEKWIDCVIICRHNKKEPHQKQDLLLEQELGRIYTGRGIEREDLPKGQVSTKRGKRARIIVDASREDIKQAWININKRCCDVPGCRMNKHDVVARVLSKPFVVEESGSGDHWRPRLESRYTLAEVLVEGTGKEAEKEAKQKAVAIAEKLADPLTLDILGRIKRPAEYGYTFMQIFDAMKPYVMRHLRHYCNFHFPEEDGHQQAAIGIIHALRTDRAIAPFSGHAFRHIQTAVRREGMTTGLIRHGERDCDMFGNKGGLVEVNEEDGSNIYGSLRSADANIGEGQEISFYDRTPEPDPDPGPLDQLVEKEQKQRNLDKLDEIIDGANLSDQQMVVVSLTHGVTRYIDNPYEAKDAKHAKRLIEQELKASGVEGGKKAATPNQIKEAKASIKAKAQAFQHEWAHNGTEAACVMGCSRQRIGQQTNKSMKKLEDSAEDQDVTLDD